jgi:AmmeMemoRadiSam system protein A
MEQKFSSSDREAILSIAESAIREAVSAPPSVARTAPDIDVSGLFVTVRVEGRLRGCIGFLEISSTFEETLREAARRTVTADLRFDPIDAVEIENLEIDVTLLGPLVPMTDADDFTLGDHGLVIESHGRRGLLLPQVPVERGWNKEQFLDALAEKAALPHAAWRNPGSTLSRFTGTVLKGSVHSTM